MPLRLRLALWHGGFSLVVIGALAFVAFAIHGRAQYKDVDRLLADEADDYRQALVLHGADDPLPQFRSRVFARLYDREGRVLPASQLASPDPPAGADETFGQDGGPAYGPPLSWLPDWPVRADGAYATVRETGTGERIRLYAVRLNDAPGAVGSVQTWMSLAAVDQSLNGFRLLVLGIGGGGLLAISLGSLTVAGRALAPIRGVTRAARAIAASRDFDRRVPELSQRDELGELSRTFNEMLASLERAYEAQRRFVADAAHELRAPLTVIQGNIQLLARVEDMPADERRETLAALRAEVSRLTQLVNDLLTLARADAQQPIQHVPVELDAVLLETLSEMRAIPGAGRIRVESIEPMPVDGDAHRLKELVLALVDNALQYTSDGDAVRVSLRRDADTAVLEVADTGIGIPAGDLPHVFERFYRAESAAEHAPTGTGLGLPIARWIVDQHAGEILIESVPGEETTVTVRLPAFRTARG